jgi:hypothetical protein
MVNGLSFTYFCKPYNVYGTSGDELTGLWFHQKPWDQSLDGIQSHRNEKIQAMLPVRCWCAKVLEGPAEDTKGLAIQQKCPVT